jgi:hypothetical protein
MREAVKAALGFLARLSLPVMTGFLFGAFWMSQRTHP